jgi:hypothetical protein
MWPLRPGGGYPLACRETDTPPMPYGGKWTKIAGVEMAREVRVTASQNLGFRTTNCGALVNIAQILLRPYWYVGVRIQVGGVNVRKQKRGKLGTVHANHPRSERSENVRTDYGDPSGYCWKVARFGTRQRPPRGKTPNRERLRPLSMLEGEVQHWKS